MIRIGKSLFALVLVTALTASWAFRDPSRGAQAGAAEPQKADAATPRPGGPALDEALAKAAELRKKADDEDDPPKQRAYSAEFADALRATAEAYTEVPVAKGKAPRFAKLVLNKRRLGFDAIRFKPPRGPATWDLRWEFVIPMHDGKHDLTGWFIVPGKGDLRGFRNYAEGIDDKLEGVDMPKHRHVYQGLGGGVMEPGETYFIWFTFQEGTGDLPMYVRMWVTPPPSEVAAQVKATKAVLRHRVDMPGEPGALAPAAGGKRVLVAIGPTVQVVDAEAGRIKRQLEPNAGDIGGLAVTNDAKTAAIGLTDGTIRLWDVDAGKETGKLEGHSGTVNDLAFSPDGKKLISGGTDRTARIWDVAAGKDLHKLEGYNDQVLRVAFAPDGKKVATGASVQDPVGRVWNAETGKLVTRLEGNAEAIYAIAFSPDSRMVLTGGEDDSIRLFDATKGREIRRFENKSGNVNGVGFLPGARRAASAGEEGDVIVWDVASGRELARYVEHSFYITRLAVAPESNFVFTGAPDRSLRIWEIPAGGGPKRKGR